MYLVQNALGQSSMIDLVVIIWPRAKCDGESFEEKSFQALTTCTFELQLLQMIKNIQIRYISVPKDVGFYEINCLNKHLASNLAFQFDWLIDWFI